MLAPALACLAVAWVLLVAVTPLLPSTPSAILYAVGSFICHQRPDRSFHLGEFQLPVCARCFGIYAGAAAGALAACGARRGSAVASLVSSGRRLRALLAAAAVPTAVTLVLEWAGMWRTSNEARAVAGILLGFAVAAVVVGALATLHYDGCVSRRQTASSPPRSSRT